jgi:membrane fusion protein (multidrug efflux system)
MSGRKKSLILAIVAFFLVAAVIAGLYFWWLFNTFQSTDDAYVDADITQISTRIPGTITGVYVVENQSVKQGQLLVRLDPQDYRVRVQQAQAALEKAERQAMADLMQISQTATTAAATGTSAVGDIQNAQSGLSSAQAMLGQQEAAVTAEVNRLNSTIAQAKQYRDDELRYRGLVREGAVSRQQYEQITTNLRIAESNVALQQNIVTEAQERVRQYRANVLQALSNLTKARSSAEQARAARQATGVRAGLAGVSRAGVAQAEADLRNALLQESYSTVTAPIDGRVGRKTVVTGEQVQTGQQLMTIVPDLKWITANFKETQIGKMLPGQNAEINIDAFDGRKIRGWVESLGPASGAKFALLPPENATGNFTKVVQRLPVRIKFDPNSIAPIASRIAPGLSVEVTVRVNDAGFFLFPWTAAKHHPAPPQLRVNTNRPAGSITQEEPPRRPKLKTRINFYREGTSCPR